MATTIIGLFRRDGEPDHLAGRKALAAWLAEQPANDDLGLQEAMIRLLEDMGARHAKASSARIRAVLELDRLSQPLQERLLRQFLHPALSDVVRQRLWHANEDLARWFAYTFENFFTALGERRFPLTARSLLPGIVSRMFHYRGAQAKQGLFRYERWIPGRWKGLHDAYAEAIEREVARTPYASDPAAPPAERYSAEEEYIQILLLQRVNSGSFTPVQIEVVATWLRRCAHLLRLAPPPLEGDGFWLDLGLGDGLLTRKPQSPQGPVLYLDIAPLHGEMERGQVELAALAESAPAGAPQADAATRLALLKRIDPLLRPRAKPIERRGDRQPTDRPVSVAVGLSEIAAALHSTKADTQADSAGKRRRKGGADAGTTAGAGRSSPEEAKSAPIEYAGAALQGQSGWRMHDSSESGCCLVSNAQESVRQRLGGVLGIQDEGDDRWKIGIIRRLQKLAGGRIEAGVEFIALHSFLIEPKPASARDSGYSVDGIDVSAENGSFDALYLPPSSGGRVEPLRSMLVPVAEHSEGRRLSLTMGTTAYTVELAAPLERGKDWVWTRFSVISRGDA
jgi:hypothetical protein